MGTGLVQAHAKHLGANKSLKQSMKSSQMERARNMKKAAKKNWKVWTQSKKSLAFLHMSKTLIIYQTTIKLFLFYYIFFLLLRIVLRIPAYDLK